MSIGIWKNPDVTAPIIVTERVKTTTDMATLQPERERSTRPRVGAK